MYKKLFHWLNIFVSISKNTVIISIISGGKSSFKCRTLNENWIFYCGIVIRTGFELSGSWSWSRIETQFSFFAAQVTNCSLWTVRFLWRVRPTDPGSYVLSRRSYHKSCSMGATLLVDDPELAPVLSGTHLPTSEGCKVELA